MSQLKDLNDLFHHQLKDIYNAEQQLIKALPEMEKEAISKELKKAFSEHLDETKNHKDRLDKIADQLNIDIGGETCEAMQGLIKEAKNLVSEDAEDFVRDAGIIADAQRIEHYEISAYGTARHFASVLGYDEIANLLQETLDEESHADQLLNEIAVDNVNQKAKA